MLALQRILKNCWGKQEGVVDITDGEAFHWRRYVANTMECKEISRMDLEMVFALRTADSTDQMLALVLSDSDASQLAAQQGRMKRKDAAATWAPSPTATLLSLVRNLIFAT